MAANNSPDTAALTDNRVSNSNHILSDQEPYSARLLLAIQNTRIRIIDLTVILNRTNNPTITFERNGTPVFDGPYYVNGSIRHLNNNTVYTIIFVNPIATFVLKFYTREEAEAFEAQIVGSYVLILQENSITTEIKQESEFPIYSDEVSNKKLKKTCTIF